jgi:hypothetical protein
MPKGRVDDVNSMPEGRVDLHVDSMPVGYWVDLHVGSTLEGRVEYWVDLHVGSAPEGRVDYWVDLHAKL